MFVRAEKVFSQLIVISAPELLLGNERMAYCLESILIHPPFFNEFIACSFHRIQYGFPIFGQFPLLFHQKGVGSEHCTGKFHARNFCKLFGDAHYRFKVSFLPPSTGRYEYDFPDLNLFTKSSSCTSSQVSRKGSIKGQILLMKFCISPGNGI